MPASSRLHPRLLVAALALTAACAGNPGADDVAPAAVRQQIVHVLGESAVAWNQGDLEGFLEPYLDSPETTFAGRDGFNHGLAAIRDGYRRSYWKDGAPADKLAFDILEVRPLAPDAALVLGRYMLTAPGASAPGNQGIFSLVFRRIDGQWKIVHDHSSGS